MAIERPYTLERGIPFSRIVTVTKTDGTAVDLTDAVLTGRVRVSKLPLDVSSLPFGTGLVAGELTMEPVDLPAGKFQFTAPALERGIYDYDIISSGGTAGTMRIMKGQFTVEEVVTHA